MLTTRGWWLLTIAAVAALLGALPTGESAPAVPIFGLTVALWVAVEWALFMYRLRASAGRVTVVRQLVQGGRPVATAWAGLPCTVRVTITLDADVRFPLVFVADRVPVGRTARGGSAEFAGELRHGVPLVLEYVLRPRLPGVLRFEGVDLRLADLGGLLFVRRFLRDPQEVLILPPLVDEDGRQRATKRFNTLPPPGVHRLRRAGGGSELLDLREYIPGDPPKTIAWKASARRDRLITKVYESDVPVRCTLLLDASQGVRVGPPGDTPLARMVTTGAAVAQAAAGHRDLVGLTIFDEHAADPLPPARNKVHTVRLLGKMAEAAGRLPDPGGDDPKEQLKLAYPVARELYPDLLDKQANALPWGLYWRPLLDTRLGWLPVLLILSPVLVLKRQVAETLAQLAFAVSGRGYVLLTMLILLAVPVAVGLLSWGIYGVSGFLHPHYTRTRRRKQLSAVFVALDAAPPAMIERYLKDDEAFSRRAGKFLADHRVRVPVELYDDAGGYRYAGTAKVQVLADALVRSVARARDNELYVILADLTEVSDKLEPLVKAVRAARGRHHDVMVIVPWPDDIPLPADAAPRGPKAVAIARPADDGPRRMRVTQLVKLSLVRGYQMRFDRARAELARVGAGVIRVTDADVVETVLERLDRLRGLRGRR